MSAANLKPANLESAGSGATWFKIWEWPPTYSKSTGLVFASENVQQVTFTIPKNVPSGIYLLIFGECHFLINVVGQYLLRVEQIALHVAETYGGAQFYLACAQINVSAMTISCGGNA